MPLKPRIGSSSPLAEALEVEPVDDEESTNPLLGDGGGAWSPPPSPLPPQPFPSDLGQAAGVLFLRVFPGGADGRMCSPRRCCGLCGVLALLFSVLLGNFVRDLYPEHALWIDNVCRGTDMWQDTSVSDDGLFVSSQRSRVLKHHPALDNPVVRGAEALLYGYKKHLAPGPDTSVEGDMVVLVAMHHKTVRHRRRRP